MLFVGVDCLRTIAKGQSDLTTHRDLGYLSDAWSECSTGELVGTHTVVDLFLQRERVSSAHFSL